MHLVMCLCPFTFKYLSFILLEIFGLVCQRPHFFLNIFCGNVKLNVLFGSLYAKVAICAQRKVLDSDGWAVILACPGLNYHR